MSCVPEALSSIRITSGGTARSCSTHGALEVGKRQLLAQDVQEIEVRALEAPGRADGIVGELGRLVGGVPALDDPVELVRTVVRPIAAEPGLLDHAAASRRRRLLVLAGEIVLADRRADLLERLERLALRVERFAGRAAKRLAPNGVSTTCTSSTSAIAGNETTSQPSCLRTWPTRSSSCSRCMTMTIAPFVLSLRRE